MPKIDIVATDADPEYINSIGLEIFRLWREFASGQRHLGGRKIENPTGRYAASISIRRYGTRVGIRTPGHIPTRVITRIAVIADATMAPEAVFLERGHRPIDMLNYLDLGKIYPMHRQGPTPQFVSGGMLPHGAYGRRRVRQMWAQTRGGRASGYARTPASLANRGATNTSGTGPAWTIPAMPAYSPAQHLAELFANAKGVELTVTP